MARSTPRESATPKEHVQALHLIFRGLDHYLRSGGNVSNAKRVGRESLFFIYEGGNSGKYARHPISTAASRLRANTGKAYDHAIPLEVWLLDLLRGDLNDFEGFHQTIARWYHIRIITKEEHEALDRLGLGDCMPGDWDGIDIEARYKKAGISFC